MLCSFGFLLTLLGIMNLISVSYYVCIREERKFCMARDQLLRFLRATPTLEYDGNGNNCYGRWMWVTYSFMTALSSSKHLLEDNYTTMWDFTAKVWSSTQNNVQPLIVENYRNTFMQVMSALFTMLSRLSRDSHCRCTLWVFIAFQSWLLLCQTLCS